jgi:hypothetical protein
MTTKSPTKTKSPAKKKEVLLTFPEAIQAIIDGKKVARKDWGDNGEYGLLKDAFLMIHRPDGRDYKWEVADGDLVSRDWYIHE